MINNDRPPRRLKPQVQMSVDGYIAAAAYQNNLLQKEMAARKKIFVSDKKNKEKNAFPSKF